MKTFSRLIGTIALFLVTFFLIGVVVPHISYTIDLKIERPQNVVFQALTDSDLLPQWISGLETSKLVNGETGVPGSIYSMVINDGARSVVFSEEVLRFEPDSVLSYSLESKAMAGKVVIRSTQDGSFTRLKIDTELTGRVWFMKSLLPLYSTNLKERNTRDYQKLKSILELD